MSKWNPFNWVWAAGVYAALVDHGYRGGWRRFRRQVFR